MKQITILFFLLFNLIGFSQGSICADPEGIIGATPFCSVSGVEFPNCNFNNPDCTNFSEVGPDYGCLIDTPFPAWYYLQIEDPGDITLRIEQTTMANRLGIGLDVDFICWGPFTDPVTPCVSELTFEKTIDCSFSSAPVETFTIRNAQVDDFYLLLITNFSGREGFISFGQTLGEGSTDCSILSAALGPNQNNCNTDPVLLDGETEGAVGYEWMVFNEDISDYEIISGETEATFTVESSGKYRILIEDINGDKVSDEIEILLNEPPVIADAPQDLVLCEEINGTATFDLSSNSDRIIGDQDNTEFTILYYATLEDANLRQNPIESLYTSENQKIYARLERTRLPSCFVITGFDLIVNLFPKISTNEFNFLLCEKAEGSNNDAILEDINSITNELLNSEGKRIDLLSDEENLDLNDFEITYHQSVFDFQNKLNSIQDGDILNKGQDLFIRVENRVTGCYNNRNNVVVKIDINQTPIFKSETNIPFLVQCAKSVEQKNVSIFDLRENDINISSSFNSSSTKVIYYLSEQDFRDNRPIEETEVRNFQNTVSPQVIYASLVDENSKCEKEGLQVVNFELRVVNPPVLSVNKTFSGEQKVCVRSNGDLFNFISLGEDLSQLDGGRYKYDWTPDNEDLDGDGEEDAIFRITNLKEDTLISLNILREDPFGRGLNCENNIDPITGLKYEIMLRPTSAPTSIDTKVLSKAFSNELAVETFADLPIGDKEDLEYSIGNGVYQDSPIFEKIPPGIVKVLVKNKFGCFPSIESKTIDVLEYPKFFSPNNDGINDRWNLISTQIPDTAVIFIFDRYGKLLKQIFSNGGGWDGSYNGNPLPSSNYWFRVEYEELGTRERKEISGNFLLKR